MRDAWLTTRLKYIAACNSNVLPETTDEGFEFRYVDIGNVTQGSMDLDTNLIQFSAAPSRARRLATTGDSVVSTVRTYLRAVATVPESTEPLVFSTGFAVLQPRQDVCPAFLSYYLQSDEFVDRVVAHSDGVSYPAITASRLVSLHLRLPPREEQQPIADYLDRETAHIDALIAKQEALIETLRERRAGVVAQAFDGNVKASRLRHGCLAIVDCPHTTPLESSDGEYESVRTASVRDGKYLLGTALQVSQATWSERNRGGKPELGDVMFTREAPAGEACMVPHPNVCLGQRMVLLKVDAREACGEFIVWQIYSPAVQAYFDVSTNGSTVGNLRLTTIRNTPIWLPSVAEQRRVAASLNEKTSKIDTLIAKAEQFITLAKERRAALITAAVTGQIKIKEAA